MNEPLSRAERIQAEASRASADAWSRWADDIAERLSKAETRLTALLGDDAGELPGGDVPALFALVNDMADEERKERATAIGRIADALTERLAAEVAVLDERFSTKLDSKIFDLASLKEFKTKLAADLEAEVAALAGATDARLAEIERRVDNVDARRRADRQAAKETVKELGVKLLTLSAAKTGAVERTVAKLAADLAVLEHALADVGAISLTPDTPALPPPGR
jgi:hypothetical protein